MELAKILLQKEARKPDKSVAERLCNVLTVCKQVERQFDENCEIIVLDDYKLTITVSYDEKLGIQTIANTSDDLHPTDENGKVSLP